MSEQLGPPAESLPPESLLYWDRTQLLREERLAEGGLRMAIAIAHNVGHEEARDKIPGLLSIVGNQGSRANFFMHLRLLREQRLITSSSRLGRLFWQPQTALTWAVYEGIELPGFERLLAVAQKWDPDKKRFRRDPYSY